MWHGRTIICPEAARFFRTAPATYSGAKVPSAKPTVFFGAAGRAPMTNESLETLKQATTTTPTAANSVELNGVYALLHEKVRGLKYGEVCVYHSGSLAADRLNSEQLNTLATSVSFMAERKRIQLCQRRLAEN